MVRTTMATVLSAIRVVERITGESWSEMKSETPTGLDPAIGCGLDPTGLASGPTCR